MVLKNFLKIKKIIKKLSSGGILENIENKFDSQIYQELPELITLKDIQTIFKIGRTLAYFLVQHQEIKSFKVGREWRILKKDLINYIVNKK